MSEVMRFIVIGVVALVAFGIGFIIGYEWGKKE